MPSSINPKRRRMARQPAAEIVVLDDSDDDATTSDSDDETLSQALARVPLRGPRTAPPSAPEAPRTPPRQPTLAYSPDVDETCLVRVGTLWWPARVLAVGDRIDVETEDGTRYTRGSTTLMFLHDPRVMTVALGTYRTIQGERSAAGLQSSNPGSPCDEFRALSLEQQLEAIKPRLRAVTEESFAPAQARIDLFFAGHDAELGATTVLGDYSDDEVVQIELWARRWFVQNKTGRAARLTAERCRRFVELVLRHEAIIAMAELGLECPIERGNDGAHEITDNEAQGATREHRVHDRARDSLVRLQHDASEWERRLLDIKFHRGGGSAQAQLVPKPRPKERKPPHPRGRN